MAVRRRLMMLCAVAASGGAALAMGLTSRRVAVWRSAALLASAQATAAFATATKAAGATRRFSVADHAFERLDAGTDRVVAVGDVHGDLAKLRQLLVRHGLEDGGDGGDFGYGRWTGGGATLVQVGDCIDRGPYDVGTLLYLESLARQAARAGGAVVRMLGNHELLNCLGDMRFIIPETLREPMLPPAGLGSAFEFSKPAPDMQALLERRIEIFKPGHGWLATDVLSRFLVYAKVGSTVFVHGSLAVASRRGNALDALLPGAKRGETVATTEALEAFNAKTQQWLREGEATESSGPIFSRNPAPMKYPTSSPNARQPIANPDKVPDPPFGLMEAQGPLWDRRSSRPAGAGLLPKPYDDLGFKLAGLGAKRLVVGHTPQIGTGINSAPAAGGAEIWRIDTGMSDAFRDFGGGIPEALEILRDGEEVNVLTLDGKVDARSRDAAMMSAAQEP